jgi:polysaccharide transporter, PST family
MITIAKRIFGHHELKRLLTNISWLSYDRIFRLGVGVFVIGFIARYLGIGNYGNLNYAISYTGLFGTAANLGLDNVIIREIVKNINKKDEILGTSFVLRLIGGFFVCSICVLSIFFIKPEDNLTQLLVIVLSSIYVISTFDIINIWFQSQIKSKYTVISANFAFIIVSIIKILMVLLKSPLLAFAIANAAEIILAQLGLIIMFRRTGNTFKHWKFNFTLAKEMLHDSWPLVLAFFSSMLYMRIDQVMIGQIVNYSEVGVYSAAVSISEVWYFVPMALFQTFYPKIVESKQLDETLYYNRLQKYFSLMVLIAYLAILPTYLFKNIIVQVIFGKDYLASASILSIHIWAGIFVAVGIARYGWIMAENRTKVSLYTCLIGAVVNILLNIPLIKMFGGIGAAWATLISQGIVGYLSTIFISKKVFLMQTRSFFLKDLYSSIRDDILQIKH